MVTIGQVYIRFFHLETDENNVCFSDDLAEMAEMTEMTNKEKSNWKKVENEEQPTTKAKRSYYQQLGSQQAN